MSLDVREDMRTHLDEIMMCITPRRVTEFKRQFRFIARLGRARQRSPQTCDETSSIVLSSMALPSIPLNRFELFSFLAQPTSWSGTHGTRTGIA
jgi:hypothetical protein